MCILFLDYRPDGSSKYVLVAANNRDEFYLRDTAKANFWEDNPNILAGKTKLYTQQLAMSTQQNCVCVCVQEGI